MRKPITNLLLFNLIFILCTFCHVHAQTLFENFYYSDDSISFKGNAVLELEHEIIVVGETGKSNVPNSDIKNKGLIIRFSKDGRILQQSILAGIIDEMFYDIIQTEDGFLICGRTDTFGEGNADVLLVKCDHNLNIEWSKSYGGTGSSVVWGYDIGYSICATSDGGFAIAGTTSSNFSTTPDRNDVYLFKIDADGILLWTKTFGKSNFDYANSVTETQSGALLISGTINFSSYFIKTDASGNKIWSMESGSNQEGLEILETNDGQAISLSFVNGIVGPFGTIVPSKLIISKMDTQTGQNVWSKVYIIETEFFGLAYLYVQGASLIKTDNDYVISGTMGIYLQGDTEPSAFNPFTMKLDSNGDVLWANQYPHEDDVHIHDIVKTDDGFMATGYHNFPPLPINKKKLYLLKTNALGKSCNSLSFTPEYGDTLIVNTPPGDNNSSGGFVNSFSLNSETSVIEKEEICLIGCEQILVQTNNPIILEDARANIRIEANGSVPAGNSINYQAGSEILINPIFDVSLGAEFHAFIAACN